MTVEVTKVHSEEEIHKLAEQAIGIWNEHYIGIITKEQVDYMIGKFQSAEAVTRQIEVDGYEYFNLNVNQAPIGYMAVKEEGGKLFLSKLYMLKESRGNGYASDAMLFLENLCKQRNLESIWLTVNRENLHTIDVYKKKGFQIIAEEVNDIGHGFVMDDYIMEKRVN
ncbi:GNAT family N-acetyltransferase [Alkalicoccobacillus gibsonii]|uniref:GNAT family N-acetyltransferase n=1 Tax=Alkalicoccobacillus gibsonii TaxID=79881 RepID=A0ABU9VNP8_9BACI